MAILSKKSAAITTSIVVFGACTGLVGYAIGHNNSAPTVDPPKANTQNTALERATQLPKDTLSPTTVAADISKYIDKEVTVHGLITQVAENSYVIIGQEAEKPGALPLNFQASNINPSEYATIPPSTKSATPPAVKPAVTVTGTLKQGDRSITLEVKSIKK
jgi:hypothetical protein